MAIWTVDFPGVWLGGYAVVEAETAAAAARLLAERLAQLQQSLGKARLEAAIDPTRPQPFPLPGESVRVLSDGDY